MTSSRRRAAGFTEPMTATGSPDTTSVWPPSLKTYSTGNTGGFSGSPMSAGSSTRNNPAVPSGGASRADSEAFPRAEPGWRGARRDGSRAIRPLGKSCAGYSGIARPSSERGSATARRRFDASSTSRRARPRPGPRWSRPRDRGRRGGCRPAAAACRSPPGPEAARTAGDESPAAQARWPRACPDRTPRASPRSTDRSRRPRHAVPRRVHSVEEIPGGGLASEQAEALGLRCAGERGVSTLKPCVLCMPRLRAAMAAKDSPDTGSLPPISSFSSGAALSPAAPAPAPPRPTLWKMRVACHGVSSRSCSGNACGSPASLKASTARTTDAV